MGLPVHGRSRVSALGLHGLVGDSDDDNSDDDDNDAAADDADHSGADVEGAGDDLNLGDDDRRWRWGWLFLCLRAHEKIVMWRAGSDVPGHESGHVAVSLRVQLLPLFPLLLLLLLLLLTMNDEDDLYMHACILLRLSRLHHQKQHPNPYSHSHQTRHQKLTAAQ